MTFSSYASGEFWEAYRRLPAAVQRLADKQFALFQQNPAHPSLRLKAIGPFWSARISRAYRALALGEGDALYWFWIGSHDDYEKLLQSL